jgi:hypothetical protein
LNNKKETTKYYQNILDILLKNLERLEEEKSNFSYFSKVRRSINKNIKSLKTAYIYYAGLLQDYENRKLAEQDKSKVNEG